MTITLLGYAFGDGANDVGCAQGPQYLFDHHAQRQLLEKHLQSIVLPLIQPIKQADKYDVIAEISHRLAKTCYLLTKHHDPFLVIGGDHTCAIGTWKGVANAIKEKGDLGLIWVDAHFDSHTPETSESGNIHGMPLAVLLGYGDERLTQVLNTTTALKPENVCIVGARSFESGEKALLERLNLRIFYMDEIQARGLDTVMHEAIKIVSKNTVNFGLSIDLDAFDPEEAPGVGKPEVNGLSVDPFIEIIEKLVQVHPQFLSAEIAEFNPLHDRDDKTLKTILKLMMALYGEKR